MVVTRKVKIFFGCATLIFSLLIITTFVNSIGYNLLTNNRNWNTNFQFLFPEGWAFFTKDATDELTTLYAVQRKGETVSLQEVDIRNGSPKAWFGISRSNRLLHVEMYQIINQIDLVNWVPVAQKDTLLAKVAAASPGEIVNFVQHPVLNGEYVIVKQKPVPWSWRKNKENLFMPGTFAHIKIKFL
jgi:antimicrobial peptide system SdpA family protein